MMYYHFPSLDADFGTVRSGLEPSAEIGMRGFYRYPPPNPLFRADHPGAPPLVVDSRQVEDSLIRHLKDLKEPQKAVTKYALDANAVAYISKHPWKAGDQTPFHNPVDVFEWGLHTPDGVGTKDAHRPCGQWCNKWDGRDSDDNPIEKRRALPDETWKDREILDTAARPPGPVRRGGCSGCYASFYDVVKPPTHTPEERQELLELYAQAVTNEEKQAFENRRRLRLAAEWDEFLDDERNVFSVRLVHEETASGEAQTWEVFLRNPRVRDTWQRTRPVMEATIPAKHRTFSETERSQFNCRRIKLETKVNTLRQSCIKAGFDPVRVLASGGLTLP